nr:conserved hypothetical protein [Albugo laibachii Nc14]|eukprot:CCA13883.1 conserved hypothetical protein [Albugo laibachii Nc14]
MSLSEFTHFLAAYFEYSELFSYEKLQQTYQKMHSTYPPSSITLMFVMPSRVVNGQAANATEADFARMTFPCYLEFFCRIAILYFSATAQINEDEHHETRSRSPLDLENCLAPFIANFTQTSHGSFDTPTPMRRLLHSQSITKSQMNLCIVRLIEIMDATNTSSEEILERYVFGRRGNGQSYKSESSKSIGSYTCGRHMQRVPVNVRLLREILLLPESLNNLRAYTEILQAQHTKDFELAVTRLESFQAESLATRSFLYFDGSSICDSACNDTQALRLYIDALDMIQDLSLVHPGRAMAESCVGTTLYYAGEFELARKYHQEALATRIRAIMSLRGKSAEIMMKSIEGDDFNTAIAMNNLACCLYSTGETECDGQACLLIDWAFRIYKKLYGLESPRTSQVAHKAEMIRSRQLKMRKKLPEANANMEYLSVISNAFLQIVVPKDPAQPRKEDRGIERNTMRQKKGESKRKQK